LFAYFIIKIVSNNYS